MQLNRVTAASAELAEVARLYDRAFPANERWDLDAVLRDDTGISELLSFSEDGGFAGFAITLSCGGYTHLIYFAVAEDKRSRGYGSEALRLLGERYPGNVMMVDIEREHPGADNNAQRRRRKEFYRRCGYTEAGVEYSWRGEQYEILILGGEISTRDYFRFWHSVDEHSSIFD